MASGRPSQQQQQQQRHRRGGVTVTTVRRRPTAVAHSTRSAAAAGAGSASSSRGGRRRSKPSKRYAERVEGAATAGGDFYKDQEIGKQFEESVLELYEPSTSTNASTRKLSLRKQAQRDGDAFHLPTLTSMCLDVIAAHFATHILPLEYDMRAGTKTALTSNKSRKTASSSSAMVSAAPVKRMLGILGIPVADEDADGDFVPGAEEGTSPKKLGKQRAQMPRTERKRKQGAQEDNAELLHILQPALNLALQMHLEHKTTHLLTSNVMGRYFLSREKVKAAGHFRAVSVEGGIDAAHIGSLLRLLYLEESSRATTRLVVSPRPNAATILRTLHLQAFTRLSSSQLAPLFAETVNLETICLRGCISVTGEAIRQLAQSAGKNLRVVNLNWTSVGLAGFEAVVSGAPNLEILKVAHVRGLTNTAVSHVVSRATDAMLEEGYVPLGKLRRLKITGTEMGPLGILSLLKHCGTRLQSLDIGGLDFTKVDAMELLLPVLGLSNHEHEWDYDLQDHTIVNSHGTEFAVIHNSRLEKISMAGTAMSMSQLLRFLNTIPRMRALRIINLNNIKTIPVGSGSSNVRSGIRPTTCVAALFSKLSERVAGALCIDELMDNFHGEDPVRLDYRKVYDTVLERAEKIDHYIFERVSLSTDALESRIDPASCSVRLLETRSPWYIDKVQEEPRDWSFLKGVRCLDMSGWDLTAEWSSYYARAFGLYDQVSTRVNLYQGHRIEASGSAGEALVLSGCKIADASGIRYFAGSGSLRSLDLSQSIVTKEAIDVAIDENPYLERLDLTGCRAIPVRERRTYLELRRGADEVKSEQANSDASTSSSLSSPFTSPSP